MELSFAALTDVGRQRTHNEDNFLIDKKLRLFLVADGMGGHAAGEVASSIAVHEIRDVVNTNRELIDRYRVDQPGVQVSEILQVLEHAVQAACAAVHARAQAEADKRGMGTTATVLLIAGAPDRLRGFIAHVGDSRVYLTRQSQCHVLTEDHSLMNELVRRGKLNREQIDASPYKQYKNAVTRAVGVYASVEVDTFDFDILPGDRFLLCSDGMYAVLAGAVKLSQGDQHLTELGHGQHFGEMALIERSVRSLTATATAGTRLLVIARKDLYEIIKTEPATAVKILWSLLQALGQRLRTTTSELTEALKAQGRSADEDTGHLIQD